MTRLDEPMPYGLCGYAYVDLDVLGVPVWRRCTDYPGHDGAHSANLSALEPPRPRDGVDQSRQNRSERRKTP